MEIIDFVEENLTDTKKMETIYQKAEDTNKNFDMVNNPSHYTDSPIECIDAMEAAYGTEAVMWFCICNAFKYQWRFKKKKKEIEDLNKSKWYIDKYIHLKAKIHKV